MNKQIVKPDIKLTVALENIKQSIAKIQDIQELNNIQNMASGFEEAWKRYYRSSGFGFEQMFLGWETKVRSERRMGELLPNLVKQGRPEKRLHDETFYLEDLRITKVQSFRYQKLTEIPENNFNQKILEYWENHKEPTTIGLLQLLNKTSVKNINLPKGIYSVVYADPAWPYPARYEEKNLYGAVNYHYRTISIEDLCELPVGKIAANNAVLFLWVATNFLEESFQIINSWGFEYKTNMVWIKQKRRAKIGWYIGSFHELLLVATKGSYLPQTKELVESVIEAPVGKHSQKPEIVYEIIEKLYPDDKYIELFARNKRKGWESWGDEIPKST